jgi:nondiscriminating aspartyl-tRNA synthetase
MKKEFGRIFKKEGRQYILSGGFSLPIVSNRNTKLSSGDLVSFTHDSFKRKSITTDDITIVKKANFSPKEPPVIENEIPLNTRLKARVFNLRSIHNQQVFIFRGELIRTISDIFSENDFLLVNTPTILGGTTEGRVKTFNFKFGSHDATLAMTKLVHLRYLTCADFYRVYEISPVFVNAHHTSTDHLSEFYAADFAMTDQIKLTEHMEFVNRVLIELVKRLLNSNTQKKSAPILIDDILKKIQNVKTITYNSLIKKYLRQNPDDNDVTKQLHIPRRVIEFACSTLGPCFWIYEFPEQFKQFYCMTYKKGQGSYVSACELWLNGNKVASSSFSDSNYDKQLARLALLGLNPDNFDTYLKSIQSASLSAYLGSFYIERLMMALLGIKNMKETIMFPRAIRGATLDP